MGPERVERKRPSYVAPKIFSFRNENHVAALREEISFSAEQEAIEQRCQARKRLCLRLQEVDPQNPTWRYGKEFFETFPHGPKAIWRLFEQWGVFQKSDGTLTPPPELREAHPRETLDLDPETVASLIAQSESRGQRLGTLWKNELFIGAKEARNASLEQYHLLKSGLLGVGEIPLLARDFIQSLTKSAQLFPDIPVCVIGLSADEASSYNILMQKVVKKEVSIPPLVGLDRRFSPALKRLEIKEGRINLEPSRIYLTQADIRQGIPLPDNSVILGALYVLHHIPPAEQKRVLQEMIRVSTKPKDGSFGVALHLFEALSSQQLLRMVLETNWYLGNETSAFDAAVGTTICGGQTPESFLKLAKEADPSIPWSAKVYPSVPKALQMPIYRWFLPPQQVGLKSY